jgi:hypothetical protein
MSHCGTVVIYITKRSIAFCENILIEEQSIFQILWLRLLPLISIRPSRVAKININQLEVNKL